MPCNHAHGAHTEAPVADRWTKSSAVTNTIAGYIGDAYWLACLFDTAAGFQNEIIGLSYYALGFGCVIAFLSAGGSNYCHFHLTRIHQGSKEDELIAPTNDDISQSLLPNEHSKEDELIVPTNDDISQGLLPNEHSDVECEHTHKKLTRLQWIALVGDLISHTGQGASAIIFLAQLIALTNSMTRWQKALMQCGATVFGVVGAIAGVRACKDALEITNKQHC